MRIALELAREAASRGEVPVGAVLTREGRLIGRGSNQVITLADPTAHAEIVALRAAASTLRNYRLGGTTLYVTLEPCPMCAGALVQARVERLVFGCSDPKAGASGSVYDITNDSRLNHRIEVAGGLASDEAADLLRDFFLERRPRTDASGSGE